MDISSDIVDTNLFENLVVRGTINLSGIEVRL